MITSGERMEEKRKNIEKELLEEELDLEELNKMNEDKLSSDEEEVNKFIGKKYTRNEIESSGEIEEKEKNLAFYEDANQNSKKSIKSKEFEESQELEELINDMPFMPGYIHKQVDERTFEVSLSSSIDCTVKCYLSLELVRKNIRPLVGDWIIFRYDSDLQEMVIVMAR
jgi:hypothetical protein